MARLYLVRHGEAAAGFGDHADPGLSEAGRAQAQTVAHTLMKLGALPAVSSPLARARETAQAYTAMSGVDVILNAAVAEVPSPVALALRRAWLLEAFPKLADRTAPATYWSTLGAALSEWRNAVVAAAQGMHTDTIVFTHFIPINALISAAQGVDETIVAWPDYTSVTVIETRPDGLRLIAPPSQATTLVL